MAVRASVALCLLLASTAARAEPAGGPTSTTVTVDPSIIGGEDATTCQWPTAVALVSHLGLCTGTLVHPQVVLYAAHCGTDFGEIVLGERMNATYRVPVDHCERHSVADAVGPNDYAFCVLAQPVDGMPLTPVAYGCEGDVLTRGRSVVIAGFGEETPESGDFGVKRWATTTISGADSGMILVGGGGIGAWKGDSGGPAFVQLDDGGWRAFGIVSGGPGPGQAVYYVDMRTVVPWVEEHAGIDITPCHTSDGSWQPTPECGGYATQPTGADTWATQCGGNDPLSPPSTTCGAVFAPEGNDPEVRIVSPEDGTVLDQVPADVTIDIEAMDDVAIRAVRLAVDGEVLQERMAPPWQFTGTFPKGTYELVALAQDASGNDGRSDSATLYVGEEPGCGCSAGRGAGGGELLLGLAVLLWLRRRADRQRPWYERCDQAHGEASRCTSRPRRHRSGAGDRDRRPGGEGPLGAVDAGARPGGARGR